MRLPLALSSDGKHLAYRGPGGLWVRDLDATDARLLPDTDDASTAVPPFWSPDGHFLGYYAVGKLKRVDVSGGRPETLCQLASGDAAIGATWGRDGWIIFGRLRGPLARVSESGGAVVPLMDLDRAAGEVRQIWPYLLPDGRHLIYQAAMAQQGRSGIYVASTDGQDRRLLIPRSEVALERELLAFAPSLDKSQPDHLLFLRENILMALPMDGRTREVRGELLRVADEIASFAVSPTGILAYRQGLSQGLQTLRWFDPAGKAMEILGPPGQYGGALAGQETSGSSESRCFGGN
ncbi:MAG TPA: hypothetical protein VJ732_11420, partial [Bryobacteraceae bacterium]|nr:hypothetical protein [Bryobacteraceae bacterium]